MTQDRAYANAAFIPNGAGFPAIWRTKAAAFRADHSGFNTLTYGPDPRHRIDLFRPKSPHGVLVFLHGGYWIESDRSDWSHLAAGALARGWAVAMPSYPLAPQARIHQITKDIDAAICTIAQALPGPMVVTGHSAGGHLAARMGNLDRTPLLQARVKRLVPISPLADLAPLMDTQMNADLFLDPQECSIESPALHPLQTQAHIWVGAQERPAFLWQARTLSETWAAPWTVAAGKHHFDVIDDLESPDSALTHICLDGF